METELSTKIGRCPYCHDQVELLDRSACAHCLAVHHLDCWREHGSCAACRGTRGLVPEALTPGKTLEDYIAALADETVQTRRLAAYALIELGPRARPAVPSLISSLADVDLWVRRWAIKALTAIGPAAAKARPALEALAEHKNPRVKQAVAKALAAIEESPKDN